MKVKVCGMRNRENIREIVSCKPDFLGFIFYSSSRRYVGESFDSRLLRNIPPYISKVGVFVHEDPENVSRLVTQYGFDYVQLHGDEEPSYAAALKAKKIGIIKSFPVDENIDFNMTEPFVPHCDYFLFDTRSETLGGSGEKFDWQVLQQYHCPRPFFLSGGIRPEDVDAITALRHPSLFGIDINSGFEVSPALKDVFKVNEFIKTIKKV